MIDNTIFYAIDPSDYSPTPDTASIVTFVFFGLFLAFGLIGAFLPYLRNQNKQENRKIEPD